MRGSFEQEINLIGFWYNMYSDRSYTNDVFQFKWKAWGPAGSWALCPLSNDGWVGSEVLARRVPPAEICLFSQAWAMVGEPRQGAGRMLPGKGHQPTRGPPSLSQDLDLWGLKLSLGTLPFLVKTENNVFERFIGTSLPDRDLTSRIKVKKFSTTNHVPSHPHPYPIKGLCWKLSGNLGFLRHELPCTVLR